MPLYHSHQDSAVKAILERIGKKIVMAVPLGIGKPVGFINAFYRLAEQDSSIHLTIITGLTLARPSLLGELEKRFVTPILDRLLKNYEEPLYERARERQTLPSNIQVIEFYLTPGKFLHNDYVQQNYISSNYTHVVSDLARFSVNVVAQQVSSSEDYPEHYSLSCNSDLFLQAVALEREFEKKGAKIAIYAEINSHLPFMHGDAVIKKTLFTDIVSPANSPALFAVPREEISITDHLIGLYASTLIKDDGCLQIGIGKLSNAVANALIMRQQHNADYQSLLDKLACREKFGDTLFASGGLDPFDTGLYASTEMLSDEYMRLDRAGILRKKVYDHIGLQRLLNAKKITETVNPHMLDILIENGVIHPQLDEASIHFLQKFGILKADILFKDNSLLLASGEKISPDLTQPTAKEKITTYCLGTHLIAGNKIHAGFFLGSVDFYQWLNNLTANELQQINMTSIARTNDLLWDPQLLQLQRKNARFINAAMMVTLGGFVISDGLNNLAEVSGVGGQFDFVIMAQKLPDARSIINCHSTRRKGKKIQSNILWQYSNMTLPRYLRDIVVTEYGIADCRSKTDAEVIQAILNVTDSRFQEKLLAQAKKYGKIAKDYNIPEAFTQNYPEKNAAILREFQLKGYCQPYPFGCDLTEEELVLKSALLFLKNLRGLQLFRLVVSSLFMLKQQEKYQTYLQRMQLAAPKGWRDIFYRRLLIATFNMFEKRAY